MSENDHLHAVMTALVSALAVTSTVKSMSQATGMDLPAASFIDGNSISLEEYQAWQAAEAALRPLAAADRHQTVCDGYVTLSRS